MVLKAERMTDDEDSDGHDNDGVYLENKVDLHHVECGGMSSFEPDISVLLRRILFHRHEDRNGNRMQNHDQVCLTVMLFSVQ